MEKYHQNGSSWATSNPPHMSTLRMTFNVIGCVLSFPAYWLTTVHCRWPITVDLVVTIGLAELARYVNEGRRMAYYDADHKPSAKRKKADLEKAMLELSPQMPRLECMAAVVGWREDPALFTRALESYKRAKGCIFLLVAVDGDEAEDEDMITVFNRVYPRGSAVIHVPEPLGEVAQAVRLREVARWQNSGNKVNEAECDQVAVEHCLQVARKLLSESHIQFRGPAAISQLCLHQRHMHKKGIMFTSFIFSLAIAETLDVEFLWSSDSDTLVQEDSLSRTLDAIAADPTIGGASSGLNLHNSDETAVTQLADTVYWGELYLTRSFSAASATSDCQSGPSSIFRVVTLSPIIMSWYRQTIFGKRMIINEDRHLTTNLLSRGWGVVFASDVLTATDTPTTLSRWLRQQVRWARATHIEALLQPRVYLVNHPLLFFAMCRRELGPAIAAVAILYYFSTSRQFMYLSIYDVMLRFIVSFAYNVLRNPHRLSRRSLKWVLPGIFFYYVPLPAIHMWSLFTLTADGWGTSMRSNSERVKKDSARRAWFETGFFVVWMGVIAGSVARWLLTHVFVLQNLWDVVFFALSVSFGSILAWRITVFNGSK